MSEGSLLPSALEYLARRERKEPWIAGTTSLALARALAVDEPALVRELAAAVAGGCLVYRGGYYATATFTPRLSDAQRDFFERELPPDPERPCLPASFTILAARMTAAAVVGLNHAFESLVVSGALVRVGDAVYRGSQMTRMRSLLEAELRGGGGITPAAFRDLIGTSRKYAVPLLEWFDLTGFTVRSGDVRVLREPP